MRGGDCSCTSNDMEDEGNISIVLLKKDVWREFHEVTNEMIITKTGRRMFPVVEVDVRGLRPRSVYTLEMEFIPADGARLKYQDGKWIASSVSDSANSSNAATAVYRHPESPNYGNHWMSYSVSFSKVKMCNKPDVKDFIVLSSHHKYCIQIHVLKLKTTADGRPKEFRIHTVRFPITEFITVTAYQNEEVTALKIKYNPFAKAFQANSRYKRELNDGYCNLPVAKKLVLPGPSNEVTPNGLVVPYTQTSSSAQQSPSYSAQSTLPSEGNNNSLCWNGSTSPRDLFMVLPSLHSNNTATNDAASASPDPIHNTSCNFSPTPSYSGFEFNWTTQHSATESYFYNSVPRVPLTVAQSPYSPPSSFNHSSNRMTLQPPPFSNCRRLDPHQDSRYFGHRIPNYESCVSTYFPYHPNHANIPNIAHQRTYPDIDVLFPPPPNNPSSTEHPVVDTSSSSDDVLDESGSTIWCPLDLQIPAHHPYNETPQ